MDKCFTIDPVLRTAARPKTNDKVWDKVLEAHKEKRYRDVILRILDYVDMDIANKYGNADKTQFDIPHGSINVQLHVTKDRFEVTAPFLNIDASKRIPLMRKVAELNFSPMNLSMITLDGDQLFFRYSSPLVLCEPYRTYDALREICVYADTYDDEFIKKFDAKHIREPRITHYSEEEKERGWKTVQNYIEEALEASDHFETKRLFNISWDVLTITLMRIEHFLSPQGVLRIEMEKMISYMTGSLDSLNEKTKRGKQYLNKIKNYDREAFDADLYSSETFIPFKIRATPEHVRSKSENTLAQSKKEVEQGNHLGASMTILFHFYNMFYHNDLPDDIAKTVDDALVQCSGRPWNESSEILYRALGEIMKSGAAPAKKGTKRKGFFSKLFGNR